MEYFVLRKRDEVVLDAQHGYSWELMKKEVREEGSQRDDMYLKSQSYAIDLPDRLFCKI